MLDAIEFGFYLCIGIALFVFVLWLIAAVLVQIAIWFD